MFVPGPYIELVLEQQNDGWPDPVNILHFYFDRTQHTVPDAVAAIDNVVIGAYDTWFKNALSNAWRISKRTYTDRTSEGGDQIIANGGVAGTAVGDRMPPGVCSMLRLHGRSGAPAYQGRMFITGWREVDNQTSGVPTNGVQLAMLNFGNELRTAPGLAFFPWSIVSKRLAGAVRPVAIVNPVTSVTAGARWVRQKRRALV